MRAVKQSQRQALLDLAENAKLPPERQPQRTLLQFKRVKATRGVAESNPRTKLFDKRTKYVVAEHRRELQARRVGVGGNPWLGTGTRVLKPLRWGGLLTRRADGAARGLPSVRLSQR